MAPVEEAQASAAQAAPADAVELAYREHGRDLLAFLISATREPELAADVLQESFLRLVRATRTEQPPLDSRAWLFRVAGNLTISMARRRATMRRWAPWLVSDDRQDSPEHDYLRREDRDRVHAGLAALRLDDRVALLMAANGFATSEVAAAVRRSELATRSLLCRARIRLRRELERQETDR